MILYSHVVTTGRVIIVLWAVSPGEKEGYGRRERMGRIKKDKSRSRMREKW